MFNHISKVSKSMFARLFDMWYYIVNKGVKQDLKMEKIWNKIVPKSLT